MGVRDRPRPIKMAVRVEEVAFYPRKTIVKVAIYHGH